MKEGEKKTRKEIELKWKEWWTQKHGSEGRTVQKRNDVLIQEIGASGEDEGETTVFEEEDHLLL